MINCPSLIPYSLKLYRKFAFIFLCCSLPLFLITFLLPDEIPRWPGTTVPLIAPRPGEILVHVSGAFAYLSATASWKPVPRWVCPLLVFTVAAAGSVNRGGLLAFCLSSIAAIGLFGWTTFAKRSIAIAAVLLAMSFIPGLELPGAYEGRPVSGKQIIENVISVAGSSSNEGSLQDNRIWRLSWWNDIINYTIRGPYFFTGKGFGINLATADGYQVEDDDALRSPHNSHLTFLARSGVPGLLLWFLLQASWGSLMFKCYLFSKNQRRREWSAVFGFVICYWLAFLVNASFDPALESPISGIFFWTIFGLGIASAIQYKVSPYLISPVGNHE